MYTTKTRDQIFLTRSRNIYSAHKHRAHLARQILDYTLEDLRAYTRSRFASGCAYCHQPLTARSFSLDHAIPTSQGGTFSIANLHLCCNHCNKRKANLTSAQFLQLLALVLTWPPLVARQFLARLSTGFRFYTKKRLHP
jgi:5-methylcytosine-specific restriction endonuclease McrA